MSNSPSSSIKHLNRKQLLSRIRRCEQRICNEYALIAEAKRILSVDCLHDVTMPYTVDHDDGYGTQTRHQGRKCVICFAIAPYLNPDHWIARKDQSL